MEAAEGRLEEDNDVVAAEGEDRDEEEEGGGEGDGTVRVRQPWKDKLLGAWPRLDVTADPTCDLVCVD